MTKSKPTPKKSPAPKISRADETPGDDGDDDDRSLSPRKRKRLLARVAGNIAAGLVQSSSKALTTSGAVAEVAVDIAEAILQKIEL